MSTVMAAISGFLEKVRNVEGLLPSMVRNAPNTLMSIVDEREVVKGINQRWYRIPFETMAGGNTGKMSLNFGTFGVGNTFELNHLTAGYFAVGQSHRINEELLKTGVGEGSVVDAMSRLTSQAMETWQHFIEASLHGDGTGVLTGEASAYGTAVYTFAGAGDHLGVNRLRQGMTVDVMDSTLTTHKGTRRILALDTDAKQVRLSSAPTDTPQAGDILLVRGLSVSGPATPTSFSSTYPTAHADGVGGDSHIHGLEYYLDTNPSNYILGVQKSAVPDLIPASVPAGGGALTYMHGIRLFNKLQIKRGTASTSNLIALFPVAQVQQLHSINMSISSALLTGDKFGKLKDLAPDQVELDGGLTFAGMRARVSLCMQGDRIYVIDPSQWGKTEPIPVDFYPNPAGGYLHQAHTSDAEVAAGLEFFLRSALDYFTVDPGRQGVISGLSVPAI